jgi:hypothetical protein
MVAVVMGSRISRRSGMRRWKRERKAGRKRRQQLPSSCPAAAGAVKAAESHQTKQSTRRSWRPKQPRTTPSCIAGHVMGPHAAHSQNSPETDRHTHTHAHQLAQVTPKAPTHAGTKTKRNGNCPIHANACITPRAKTGRDGPCPRQAKANSMPSTSIINPKTPMQPHMESKLGNRHKQIAQLRQPLTCTIDVLEVLAPALVMLLMNSFLCRRMAGKALSDNQQQNRVCAGTCC